MLFIARESLLWQGTSTLKKDLRTMRRLSSAESCEAKFGLVTAEGDQLYRQLRFTSSRAYVLELICPGFPDHPLIQEERVLSSFVSKAPGSAGIIERSDVPESMIGIAVFQELVKGLPESLQTWLGWISRGELVGLSEGEIVTKPLVKNAPLTAASIFGVGPISSCEGYGYTCCDTQLEYGMGDAVTGVPSCPDSCYARCIARPLVVSWRSSPSPEWGSNMLEIPADTAVQFYYVLEDGTQSGPWSATIDFGDGLQTVVEGKDGAAEHTYTCTTGICEYVAAVTVQNAHGARSAPTELSKLSVRVTQAGVEQPLENYPIGSYDSFTEITD